MQILSNNVIYQFHIKYLSIHALCRVLSLSLESFLPDLDADQHLSLFNTACSEVLNTTAPLKPKKSKPKTEPWLSDNIR